MKTREVIIEKPQQTSTKIATTPEAKPPVRAVSSQPRKMRMHEAADIARIGSQLGKKKHRRGNCSIG